MCILLKSNKSEKFKAEINLNKYCSNTAVQSMSNIK